MAVERKILTCSNCGADFAVPLSRGQYTTYCQKPSCQRVKRLKGNGAKSLASEERRAKDREERRDAARARAASERVRADVSRATGEATTREITRPENAAPLILEGSALYVFAEVAEVAERAGTRRGSGRPEIRAQVRKLAYAEGVEPTYEALIELAADVLGMASRIRPSLNQREPKWEEVPDRIEQAEVEELMAA